MAVSGIGPGDEVLVPSLTFVATVNAVLYVGAEPVFVDIEAVNRPHISIDDALTKLTERTKAVIVMHYGGYVVDLPRWRSFCDERNLILIEDAAHAPAVGLVGRICDAAAFSFFSNKNMSTAEGGMLLAKDPKQVAQARKLRAHGMSTDTLTRHLGHAYSYDVDMLGFNYRMDELRAAMGLVQLSYLKTWNRKRNKLVQIYRRLIKAHLPQVIVPFDAMHETAAHLMPVILPSWGNRKEIMDRLRSEGIHSSIHYPPIHKFDYYRHRYPDVTLNNTEEYCDGQLSLPLHPSLGEDDIARVVSALKIAIGT